MTQRTGPNTSWIDALTQQKLVVRTARDAATVVGWLDTGNYALNWAISGRFANGYPLGHMVEIFGDPSTGKSFLLTLALARVQAQGGVALLDDTEGAYNLKWMETLGVDIDTLAYIHSRTVKDHLDAAGSFIKAFKTTPTTWSAGVLACDSLALLSTDHELETRLDKRDMTKAGELKALFRIVAGELHALPVVHISTNHIIANIGNRFNPRTTPGGGGPKYQASVRIELRNVTKLRVGDTGTDYVGVRCLVVVDKNRLAAPWKRIHMTIPFYQPISRASGLIPVLLDLGILTKKGHVLQYQGKSLKLHAFLAKEKVLRQDEEAERLLDQVPELLEEADAYLEANPPSLIHAQQQEVEEDVEEDE